ncbi:basic leucine zipper 34-like [Chenopodium quinoa]|uniref:BZIP domain-containing protein n=1 Tax=Chenopodium quinoa TaxID=63459 RepID=A0A803KYB9_CHEQI|nr:basic leucine zipper 34-like [Chenopodium quinoa]
MMSTVLPSESVFSNSSSNPFNGGFTPWENLESFFTSTLYKPNDSNKPKSSNKSNLSCYHAGFGLGSERPNLSCYHAGSDLGSEQPNLSCYHAGSDLGSEFPNKVLPSFDNTNLGSCHIGSDLGSESQSTNTTCFDQLNLSQYHANFESPTQQSPPFDELDLGPYHVGTDLGSERPKRSPSYEELSPNQDQPNQNSNPTNSSSSSGSSYDDPIQNPNRRTCPDDPAKNNIDERKRKRMLSNRESARRSRMRKQKHLENLRNNANELKIQTRERSNHLRLMTHQIQHVRRENERLKAESFILQRKLMHLSNIWKLQQLQQQQCSFSTTSNLMHTPMQI